MHAGVTFLVKQHVATQVIRCLDLAARFLDHKSYAFRCCSKLLIFVHGYPFVSVVLNLSASGIPLERYRYQM